ncbi:MAG TPA: hypothetical protein VMH39_05540 [Gemmatimonadaceae bacterium]|nr:hypothetical protein [Gemmatimonadaceae bacterium]
MIARARMRTFAVAAVLAAGVGCYGGGRVGLGVVFAVREPPAERVEVIPAAPGASYVWIKGHWLWRDNDYVWTPGRWEAPPAGERVWVEGHWAHEARGWYWVEGHWRA